MAEPRNFKQLGTYDQCIAVPREHPPAGMVRDEIETHPLIRTEDTSQFYDMSVFKHCVQTLHVLLTLECWAEIHPALVTLPVDWDFKVPYGILYQLEPDEDIQRFPESIETI